MKSAELAGSLWEYNLVKVVVIDVTDDYRLMQPPLPNECYPVLAELLLPAYGLKRRLPGQELVAEYMYDWHQAAEQEVDQWYVGVVHKELAAQIHPIQCIDL